ESRRARPARERARDRDRGDSRAPRGGRAVSQRRRQPRRGPGAHMIELRFHRELYDGFAIDEAAKVYGPFAAMELAEEPEGFVVRVTASAETTARGIDERTLCAE